MPIHMLDALQTAIVPLQSNGSGAAGAIVLLVYLAILVATLAGIWKTFDKADQPGWAAIVPFYNYYVMIKVAQRPAWWLLLYFVPLVNLIPSIIVPIDIAKNFGKGTGFGLGLVFLPFVFFPMLGFGDATYQVGEGGQQAATAGHGGQTR